MIMQDKKIVISNFKADFLLFVFMMGFIINKCILFGYKSVLFYGHLAYFLNVLA